MAILNVVQAYNGYGGSFTPISTGSYINAFYTLCFKFRAGSVPGTTMYFKFVSQSTVTLDITIWANDVPDTPGSLSQTLYNQSLVDGTLKSLQLNAAQVAKLNSASVPYIYMNFSTPGFVYYLGNSNDPYLETADPEVTNYGCKVRVGSTYKDHLVKVYTGGQWKDQIVKIRVGSNWVNGN